jgi:RNA polymerase sigma-70 factor (ECF subfamily)
VRDGELVLLADQDRSLWDHDQLEEGRRALDRALALHGRGSYVLQAAIAALQTEERVDWREVALLYGELARVAPSPVVDLNRTVAVAEAEGAERGLALLDSLDLGDYRYLHSTRADFLRRLGRHEEARAAYERALALAATEHERRFLERRLAELS